ncbi:hypothetical protein LCGC14_1784990, partial [marine sediment metagenome]
MKHTSLLILAIFTAGSVAGAAEPPKEVSLDLAEGIKKRFSIQCRTDSIVKHPELVAKWVDVGLYAALLGFEAAIWIATAVVPLGGVLTFLTYEWFHMTAHLTVPKTAVERHVTRLHNQHHFRDFNKWFHVSPGGEIIDRAMGTDI